MKSSLYFFLRPVRILSRYRLGDLQPDLVAELPAQVGLYSAIVASVVGVLWGSSSQLQTGPTGDEGN